MGSVLMMDQNDGLATQFEAHRDHLRAVAYRMLGSTAEAEDAVQEAWLRLHRSDSAAIENLGGWLTVVVGRVCLDMLRSRTARREEALADGGPEPAAADDVESQPEQQALLADAVGLALLVVLDTLTPAERLAFVLHDLFDVPFDEIAPIVGRTPGATRQLASRARRRVRGGEPLSGDAARQRDVVGAFLAASRGGDFGALLALLDPDVVVRSDEAAAAIGSPAEIRGAQAVAGFFNGAAQAARLVLADGEVGAVWAPGGQPRVFFRFTVVDGKVRAIEFLADPAFVDRLKPLSLE